MLCPRRLASRRPVVLAVLMSLLAWAAYGVIEPIYRTVPRSADQFVGAETLSARATSLYGGIIAQASAEVDPAHADALGTSHLVFQSDTESLCVQITADCLQYKITYDQLVPLALWIESGATGVFTIWDNEDKNPGWNKAAGFAKVELPSELLFGREGYTAIEFATTELSKALFYGDLCPEEFCLGESHDDHGTLNQGLSWGDVAPFGDDSHVITDFQSHFEISIQAGTIVVSGVPVRYSWHEIDDVTSSRRYIEKAQPYLLTRNAKERFDSQLDRARKNQRAAEAARAAAQVSEPEASDVLVKLDELVRGKTMEVEVLDEWLDPEHHQAFLDLFRSAALLRHYKIADPSKWEAFYSSLQEHSLVNAEPWQRYARVFEEVYGESPVVAPN